MRTIALIAVLALPLAACNQAPDVPEGAVYTAPVVTKLAGYSPNESASRFDSRSDNRTEVAVRDRWRTIEERYGVTQAEYGAMSEEERQKIFAPISTRPAPAIPDEEFKPML